jgi:TonB family protein
VERCLADAADLYALGEGADAITELEICRENQGSGFLLDLTLGQLYLLAGQGEPELLPREGPAADVGDWDRNRVRLLERAAMLLRAAGRARPDDAAADFLLADVARARGHLAAADTIVWGALAKCSCQRSLEILRRYQQLNRYGAQLKGGVSPDYPERALARNIEGEVVLDLLVDPAGQVAQAVALSSPHPSLSRAAADALGAADIEPAKIGKYPIWSWLRVKTSFTLER